LNRSRTYPAKAAGANPQYITFNLAERQPHPEKAAGANPQYIAFNLAERQPHPEKAAGANPQYIAFNLTEAPKCTTAPAFVSLSNDDQQPSPRPARRRKDLPNLQADPSNSATSLNNQHLRMLTGPRPGRLKNHAVENVTPSGSAALKKKGACSVNSGCNTSLTLHS
jgi:hypothetical protein